MLLLASNPKVRPRMMSPRTLRCSSGSADRPPWRAMLVFSLVFGLVVIGETESGLVIRRYGRSLPAGRIIGTRGEAGYQARMLPPGWHFPMWRWKFKIQRVSVPLIEVPSGQIALVVAKDGAAIPSERVLGREVTCDNFQDAIRFLDDGGEKGRQVSILTAGKYRINPALFDVVTAACSSEQFWTVAGAARTCSACPPIAWGS